MTLASEEGLVRSVTVYSLRITPGKVEIDSSLLLREDSFLSVDSSDYSGFLQENNLILAKLSTRSAKELQIQLKSSTTNTLLFQEKNVQTFSMFEVQARSTILVVFSSIADNSLSIVFINNGTTNIIKLPKPTSMKSDFISKIFCENQNATEEKSWFKCLVQTNLEINILDFEMADKSLVQNVKHEVYRLYKNQEIS